MTYVVFTKRRTDGATKRRGIVGCDTPLVRYLENSIVPTLYAKDATHKAYRMSVANLMGIYADAVREIDRFGDAAYGTIRDCGLFGCQTVGTLYALRDIIVHMLSCCNPLMNAYYIVNEEDYEYFEQPCHGGNA